MSIVEKSMEVRLMPVSMIPQIKGTGLSIEPIFVEVDVSRIYDPSVSDTFYLQVLVSVKGKQFPMTGVYHKSDISDQGIILLGILYVIGPVGKEEIRYQAIIHYIIE